MIYDFTNNGHRQEVGEFLASITGMEYTNGRKNTFDLIICDRLIFATVGDSILKVFFVSFIRLLLQKRTKGIIYSLDKVRQSLIKSKILDVMVYFVQIYSTTVDEKQNSSIKIIADPQYVDLLGKRIAFKSKSIDAYDAVSYLGSIKNSKGFYDFINYQTARVKNCYSSKSFSAVNTLNFDSLPKSMKEKVNLIEIQDEPLDNFYYENSLVWCYYAPSYNQSSGIFGRALQFNLPAIIRKNSHLHAHAVKYGCEVYDEGNDQIIVRPNFVVEQNLKNALSLLKNQLSLW